MTHALLAGFLTGLSLILPIGAQNAFVLKLGLLRQHVFAVALICALSDAILIFLGTTFVGFALGQRLFQPVQQAALLKGRAGLYARQQLVQDRVRNDRLFTSGHGVGTPSFPS